MIERHQEVLKNYETALMIVDKMLPVLPAVASLEIIHYAAIKKLDYVDEVDRVSDFIKAILLKLNYAEERGPYITLTDKGRLAQKKGGHYAYEQYETKMKDLQDKKLAIDIANAERISSTYWLSFGMSVAAIVISLIILILRLIEVT